MKIWIKANGTVLGPVSLEQAMKFYSRHSNDSSIMVSDNQVDWQPISVLTNLQKSQLAPVIPAEQPQTNSSTSNGRKPVVTGHYCRNCGQEISASATICLSCGSDPKSGTDFCPTCGESTSANQLFCLACGTALEASKGGCVAGLVLGIVSCAICIIPVINAFLSLPNVAAAIVGLNLSSKKHYTPGITLNIIGLSLAGIEAIWYLRRLFIVYF